MIVKESATDGLCKTFILTIFKWNYNTKKSISQTRGKSIISCVSRCFFM